MPSQLRRLTSGAPGQLLVVLLLVARLLTPSMDMTSQRISAAADGFANLVAICHSVDATDGQQSPEPAHHHDCMLCPACHLLTHAGLPAPIVSVGLAFVGGLLGTPAQVPTATGPPRQPRLAARPTGPPLTSV